MNCDSRVSRAQQWYLLLVLLGNECFVHSPVVVCFFCVVFVPSSPVLDLLIVHEGLDLTLTSARVVVRAPIDGPSQKPYRRHGPHQCAVWVLTHMLALSPPNLCHNKGTGQSPEIHDARNYALNEFSKQKHH